MSFSLADFLKSGALISLDQDHLLIGWGQAHHHHTEQMDLTQPAFYFSDFFLANSRPWIQYPCWIEMSNAEFNAHLKPVSSSSTCHWTIHQPEQFRQAFCELSRDLHHQKLDKAVPYVFARSPSLMLQERLQNCLIQALSSIEKKAGYLYGQWEAEKGVLGITPELLFSHSQQQPNKVFSMALAGTCPSSHCQETFMNNEKEQHEHQLVVQGICQALQPLGVVHRGKMQLLQLPRLTHLMTPIEVELKDPFHFDHLVHLLHPTPALGAFPLQEGKKWLEAYQKHTPRHYYGAPIGMKYPSSGLSHCLVGIRNVEWNTCGMQIGAGCGVVKQSTFEKEWQEIQFKIRAIREQLYL